MTIEELFGFFGANHGEYLMHDRIAPDRRLHARPDLNAFLLLDRLVPDPKGRDMVAGTAHDEIWLQTDPVELAAVATEADLLDLIRCGVRYDKRNESLCMFA